MAHEHQVAFETLKQALCTAPVLAIPDFSKPFAVETDAYHIGVRAVLLQAGHPLAYVSKPLGVKTQGLSTYEKEYLPILVAVEKWRSYLQLAKFEIHTDQQALVHLNDQRLHTVWQQKVFTNLLGLRYKIVYKKGSDNSAADALSRRQHPLSSCFALSLVTSEWCSEVRVGYQVDNQSTNILTKLIAQAGSVPHFLRDGLLYYKNKLWVGNNQTMQQKLI